MLKWLLPILFFLLLAPFTPWIDMQISHFFFSEGGGEFYNNGFTLFLYRHSEAIVFVAGVIVGFVFLASLFLKRWKRWRQGTIAILLTYVLGAGVITNSLLKEFWGRPRPKQVEAFGGKHAYRPFYKPNFFTRHDPQKSFPSGHVAMGCSFFSHCLTGLRMRSRFLFLFGCGMGLFFGGGLIFARIAQGGHFFSDVCFSILLMWFVSLICDKLAFGRLSQSLLLKQT